MIYNLNFFPAREGIFVKIGKHRGLKLIQGDKNIAPERRPGKYIKHGCSGKNYQNNQMSSIIAVELVHLKGLVCFVSGEK